MKKNEKMSVYIGVMNCVSNSVKSMPLVLDIYFKKWQLDSTLVLYYITEVWGSFLHSYIQFILNLHVFIFITFHCFYCKGHENVSCISSILQP